MITQKCKNRFYAERKYNVEKTSKKVPDEEIFFHTHNITKIINGETDRRNWRQYSIS